MIKYYGTPLTPNRIFDDALLDKNTLIPFPRPDNLNRAMDVCNYIIIDNGAFTLWRKGGKIDWNEYYEFLQPIKERIKFYFIPDVIDGTEEENDHLITDYFLRDETKGIPIWHVNESFDRLERLMRSFDYVAIGSAGEYAQLGTHKWHMRMNDIMSVMCDKDGYPKVKIHMLRCLDPKIFTRYPFHSGDSTSLAQNHKRDGWRNITDRIERYNSPLFYTFRKYYETRSLF